MSRKRGRPAEFTNRRGVTVELGDEHRAMVALWAADNECRGTGQAIREMIETASEARPQCRHNVCGAIASCQKPKTGGV